MRGLLRALIYAGADPHAYVVKQAVRDGISTHCNFRSFSSDIKAARYFIRWGERQLLGGLPREILEMIMYSAWEPVDGDEDV